MAEVIAVFGGTFDPVHHGHLILARDAQEQLGLQRILFMPAPRAPLREHPATDIAHRVAMLRLAIAGEPGFEVSTLEAERAGPSYSIDTARSLRASTPGARLLWILGADQLARLAAWHRAAEFVAEVEFACAARPGFSVRAPAEFPQARVHAFSQRELALSASEIRARATQGLPIRWFLPDAVLSYAEKHALYRR
jgi:nicotinate-nucleotide adenylyltransferase